jgi:hypothetical protein
MGEKAEINIAGGLTHDKKCQDFHSSGGNND